MQWAGLERPYLLCFESQVVPLSWSTLAAAALVDPGTHRYHQFLLEAVEGVRVPSCIIQACQSSSREAVEGPVSTAQEEQLVYHWLLLALVHTQDREGR